MALFLFEINQFFSRDPDTTNGKSNKVDRAQQKKKGEMNVFKN